MTDQMTQPVETIILDSDTVNELLFKVQVEGADPSSAKVRMVCDADDIGFVFSGHAGPDGLVAFNTPVMKDRIKEGTYPARVEVMLEGRCFVPVQFNVQFKRVVTVVAESVQVASRRLAPEVRVTSVAAPVVVVTVPTTKKAPAAAKAVVPAPEPAPEVTRGSLKERHQRKVGAAPVPLEGDEDAIIAAARSFVNTRKTRGHKR